MGALCAAFYTKAQHLAMAVRNCSPAAAQVVVNKPSGLQVLPNGAFHHRCVLTILRDHFPGGSPPAPTHRLGRGTSGKLPFHALRGIPCIERRRQWNVVCLKERFPSLEIKPLS